MKILGVLLLAGAATGCRSYAALSDVAAARGDKDDVVISFTADRDVTQAAQFVQARLLVPAQLDPGQDGADEVRSLGHVRIDRDRLTRGTEGPPYAFRASFPLKGEHVYRSSGLFSDTTRRFPYDLTRPGLHALEFEVSGANCGGPGGFYTDRFKVPYRAP